MENENLEETVSGNSPDPVEGEEVSPVPETDILPSEEIVEDVEETAPPVSENETGRDAAVLGPEENGETENENTYEMENGNEDFYDSVSGNGIMGDSPGADAPATYVVNYYMTEVPAQDVVPLWENNISNFSTSEMLLFLIFLLLLVQFVHNIFKGSHWLKG